MRYVLGVDGGGTKTQVVCRSLDSEETLRESFGSLNANSDAVQARSTLNELVKWAKRQGDLQSCSALCIGCAGISNPKAVALLENTLREYGYKGPLQLVGDQLVALSGALGHPYGAVLIAGTGSICYAQTEDGRQSRVGGWGHLIDDEGSGYAIGRDILRAAVRSLDGRIPPTCLSALVGEYLGSTEIGEWIRFLYDPSTTKKEIGKLAPLLSEALDFQDKAAQQIVEHAARELSAMAATALNALDMGAGELALLGGVLRKNQAVRTAVTEILTAQFPYLSFPEPKGNAADGAVNMALLML